MVDSARLNSLKEKLAKNVDENGKLKEAIAKEEHRLKEKEKRDNEKWWKELSKGMEQLFLMRFGPDYKELVDMENIISILEADLGGKENSDSEESLVSEEGGSGF